MKIVLLCVGGISSSILAKRLQKYSDEKEKGDTFHPERYGTVSYGRIECDLFLIAPQISKLIADSPGFDSIPSEKVLYVSEEDYSSIDVESVYRKIDDHRMLIIDGEKPKERWRIDRTFMIKCAVCYLSVVIAYALIRFMETSFHFSIGVARIILPLLMLLRYSADVSTAKGENMILHMVNMLCLFMLVIPFLVIRSSEAEDVSASFLVIRELSIFKYALYALMAVTLYNVYNLWEDWFIERNRFMMTMIRDSFCSSLFFLFVIIIRLLLNFFVIK